MDVEFFIMPRNVKNVEINTAQIEEFYLVNADKTYNVIRDVPLSNPFIMVRTFDGEGELTTKDNRHYLLKNGDLLFLEHKNIATYKCKDNDWKFYWVNFELSKELDINLGEVYSQSVLGREHSGFREILRLLRTPTDNNLALSNSLFSTQLYRYICNISMPLYRTHNIANVLNYIHNNIRNNISIDDLSDMVYLSPRQFRDVFKKYAGKSPKEYISDLRLDMARELIANTNMQICEISDTLGFSNQFYFSKAFNNKFNTSPSKLRSN